MMMHSQVGRVRAGGLQLRESAWQPGEASTGWLHYCEGSHPLHPPGSPWPTPPPGTPGNSWRTPPLPPPLNLCLPAHRPTNQVLPWSLTAKQLPVTAGRRAALARGSRRA